MTQEKLISGSTVVSPPEAAIRVEQLHLTEAGKRALTCSGTVRLPGAFNQPAARIGVTGRVRAALQRFLP